MADPWQCNGAAGAQTSSVRAFRVCLSAATATAPTGLDSSSTETSIVCTGGDRTWPADIATIAQRANNEAVAAARSTLEEALRAKDMEIASANAALAAERTRSAALAEREECLRGRLVAAEETRALYQMSLHRLLDLIRCGAGADTAVPVGIAEFVAEAVAAAAAIVPLRDVSAAAALRLRSADAATNDDASSAALRAFTPDGKHRKATEGEENAKEKSQGEEEEEEEEEKEEEEKEEKEKEEKEEKEKEEKEKEEEKEDAGLEDIPAPSNALLLASSMLNASVADCVAAWARAERRHEAAGRGAIAAMCAAAAESFESRSAALSAAVTSVSARLGAIHSAVQCAARHVEKNKNENENEKRKKDRMAMSEKMAIAEAEAEAMAMAARCREANRRTEARDCAIARIVQSAAEALEDTRQCVRAAAREMERSVHEGQSLNEPFLQSMRAIAMRAEAQAQLAREAIVREKKKGTAPACHAEERRRAYERMQRYILSPPRRPAATSAPSAPTPTPTTTSLSSYITEEILSAGALGGGIEGDMGDSRLLIALEELSRVVANLARLLDNNARQIEDNATRVIRAIGGWETTIATHMGNVEAMMVEALAAAGVGETRRALQLPLQKEAQTMRDMAPFTPLSLQKETPTQSVAFHTPTSALSVSAAGGAVGASQAALVPIAHKFPHTVRTSNTTSGSCAPSLSGVGSCVSSVDVSRAASAAPHLAMSELPPFSICEYPPHQKGNSHQQHQQQQQQQQRQTPPLPTRRVEPMPGHCTPLSIAVSLATTPLQTAQTAHNSSTSPGEWFSPVSAIATNPRVQRMRGNEADEIGEWLLGSRAIVPRRMNSL